MSTILEQIMHYKRFEELPRRKQAISTSDIEACAQLAVQTSPARDMVAALKSAGQSYPGIALIAEVKKASPSRGLLCLNFDPGRLARAYAGAGAAAISVLTDEKFFQGSLQNLEQVRANAVHLPVLRKDFICDPYQVYEARAAGADALLLIAAVLDDYQMGDLMALTHSLGMLALIETRNEVEMARCLRFSPRLVGVNNRNLHNFSVNLNTCLRVRPLVPDGVCFVAESGIHSPEDMKRLADAGVNAALVGEALVSDPDPQSRMKELLSFAG